jgi:hypothetical protein
MGLWETQDTRCRDYLQDPITNRLKKQIDGTTCIQESFDNTWYTTAHGDYIELI